MNVHEPVPSRCEPGGARSPGSSRIVRSLSSLSTAGAILDTIATLLVAFVLYYVLEPRTYALLAGTGMNVLAILVARTTDALVLVALASGLLRFRRVSPATVGFIPNDWATQILNGVCAVPLVYLGPALMLLIRWLAHRFGLHEPLVSAEQKQTICSLASSRHVLVQTSAIMAVSAVGEELLFRGMLLTRLRRCLGRWTPAVILSSGLFAFVHWPGGWGLSFAAFTTSLVLSWLFIRTNSLMSTTVAHFGFNMVQVILLRRMFMTY